MIKIWPRGFNLLLVWIESLILESLERLENSKKARQKLYKGRERKKKTLSPPGRLSMCVCAPGYFCLICFGHCHINEMNGRGVFCSELGATEWKGVCVFVELVATATSPRGVDFAEPLPDPVVHMPLLSTHKGCQDTLATARVIAPTGQRWAEGRRVLGWGWGWGVAQGGGTLPRNVAKIGCYFQDGKQSGGPGVQVLWVETKRN